MRRTPEAQDFDIRAFDEQQELRRITSCFNRHQVLGYITDSLGYMTSDEIDQIGKSLYADTLADQTRPVGAVLKEIGLTRESEQLRYLRSFLGRIDQVLANTLRSTHGHDILMSHVALEYGKEEMEEKLDLTLWKPGRLMRSAAYWLAGEGPVRPLMMDFFHLQSRGLVDFQRDTNREVVLPTHRMNDTAGSLEAIIQFPFVLNRNILLVAGRSETRIGART